MLIEDFRAYSALLNRMTTDFFEALPDDKWDFTPQPSGRFGTFARQLRHVVRARGVYNEALVERRVDWTRSREHYAGPLTRVALLEALEHQQERLLRTLDGLDPEVEIDWGETPFTFGTFTWESSSTRRSITVSGACTRPSPASRRQRVGGPGDSDRGHPLRRPASIRYSWLPTRLAVAMKASAPPPPARSASAAALNNPSPSRPA